MHFNTQMMHFATHKVQWMLRLVLIVSWFLSAQAAETMSLSGVPQNPLTPEDTLSLSLRSGSGLPSDIRLYCTQSTSEDLDPIYYDPTGFNETTGGALTRQIQFPAGAWIEHGFNHCLFGDLSRENTTPPFAVQVFISEAPKLFSRDSVLSTTPEFEVLREPDVPAVHLIISRENPLISEVQPVFETISTQRSIPWAGVTALATGTVYYLQLANNYQPGNKEATDWKRVHLAKFTTMASATTDGSSSADSLSMRPLSPPSGVQLEPGPFPNSNFTFRWHHATTPGNYQLEITPAKVQSNGSVQGSTLSLQAADSLLNINVFQSLGEGVYYWQVRHSNSGTTGAIDSFSVTLPKAWAKTITRDTEGNTVATINDHWDIRDAYGQKAEAVSSEGAFEVWKLRPGTAAFCVTPPGYQRACIQKQLAQNDTTDVEIWLSPANVRIEGRVFDTQQKPLAQVDVSLHNETTGLTDARFKTFTDEEGFFRLSAPPGLWELQLRKETARQTRALLLQNTDTLIRTGDWEFESQSSGLSGFVHRPDEFTSLVKLCALSTQSPWRQYSTQTSSNGHYSMDLPPGDYFVSLCTPGLHATQQYIRVYNNITRNFDAEPMAKWIEGEIYTNTPLTNSSFQRVPAQDVFLKLLDQTADTLIAQTRSNENGRWFYSVPGQVSSFLLLVHDTTGIDTVEFNSDQERIYQSIELTRQARLEGIAHSSTALTDLPRVFLQNTTTGISFHTNCVRISEQSCKFSASDIEAGNWSISASGQVSSSNTIQTVIPLRNDFTSSQLYVSDTLHLNSDPRLLSILPSFNDSAVPVTVQMSYPMQSIYPADSLIPFSGSRINITVLPQDAKLTALGPLDIDTAASADTLLFSASWPLLLLDSLQHNMNVDDTVLTLRFETTSTPEAKPDSAWLRLDGTRYSPRETLTDSVPDTLHFDIPVSAMSTMPEISAEFYAGGIRYGSATHPWIFQLNWPAIPFRLSRPTNDTLLLASGSRYQLFTSVSALEDSSIISKQFNGTINWRFAGNSRQALEVAGDKLSATIIAESPSAQETLLLTAVNGSYRDTVRIPFRVVQRNLHTVELNADIPGMVRQQDTLNLQLQGWDSSDYRPLHLPLNVEVSPAGAAELSGNRLVIDSNFVGPVLVRASFDELSDTLQFQVWGRVLRARNESIWHYDSLTWLRFPDSAVQSYPEIWVTLEVMQTDSLSFFGYEGSFSPAFTGLRYDRQRSPDVMPYLLMSLQDEDWVSRSRVRVFDREKRVFPDTTYPVAPGVVLLKQNVPDTILVPRAREMSNPQNRLSLESQIHWEYPAMYGLQSPDSALTAQELTLMPNPFSPWVVATADGNTEAGMRITMTPASWVHGLATVSVEIFNTAGVLVKTIYRKETLYERTHTTYWDGTGDSGRMLRNGRYVLRYQSHDPGTGDVIREIIQPVVLFK